MGNKLENREVPVKLPEGTEEKSATTEMGSSPTVDEFDGELKHIIKSSPNSYIETGLFLDDNRLAVLVVNEDDRKDHFAIIGSEKPKHIYLDIYDPLNWERISHIQVNRPSESGIVNLRMVITPMRNLLINFFTDTTCYYYYLDQNGKEIWNKNHSDSDNYKVGKRSISVINDDTIIARSNGHLMIIPNEKVDGYIPLKSPPFRYATEIYRRKMKIIAYGAKGFIAYDYKEIYLRNEDKEKIFVRSAPEQGFITTVKLLNEEVLFYATSDGYLKVFNIKEGIETNSTSVGKKGKYIGTIHLLPHNRCLLLCGETSHIINRVKIYNLGDMTSEAQYLIQDGLKFVGTFSNGNVPVFSPGKDGVLLVYNILEKEADSFTFPKLKNHHYAKLLSISSTDSVAILSKEGLLYNNELFIFR